MPEVTAYASTVPLEVKVKFILEQATKAQRGIEI
jgi:hypothetical protein